MNSAKIFIAYHKESTLIKNNILEPIHVGRTLSTSHWLEENMIGDNTGNNISHKNNRYCELTAQYFVWKNKEKLNLPKYVGFMHYRRLLCFNTNTSYPENSQGYIFEKENNINELFFKKYGLSEDKINKEIMDYDLLTLKPTNIKTLGCKNVFEQYTKSHYKNDYQITMKILLNKHPEFKGAVKLYNKSSLAYFTNTFIMKTELFEKYAEWLFSILFEAEKFIPEYSDLQQNRVMGYLAERLLGIYITYLKLNNYKIKELQPIFIEIKDKNKEIIPIVFACDNNYTQHLCCTLSSILANANTDEFFKFYIINTKKNLNYISKKILSKYNTTNSIVVFKTIDNYSDLFKTLPQTYPCSHISIETYYRYILATIFPEYDKILYLDCDINVLSSLKDLFKTELENYYVAGVEDILSADSRKRLNLNKYFNAGVLLINLQKWRDDKIEERLFKYTHENKDKIVWQDQDVLNVILQDKIMYLPLTWNAQVGEYAHCYSSKHNEIANNANIIHYIGHKKPWTPFNKNPFKQIYYYYLKQTFFSVIMFLQPYNTIMYFIKNFKLLLKNTRQSIVWYDKRNKQIVFFKRFAIKI